MRGVFSQTTVCLVLLTIESLAIFEREVWVSKILDRHSCKGQDMRRAQDHACKVPGTLCAEVAGLQTLWRKPVVGLA